MTKIAKALLRTVFSSAVIVASAYALVWAITYFPSTRLIDFVFELTPVVLFLGFYAEEKLLNK